MSDDWASYAEMGYREFLVWGEMNGARFEKRLSEAEAERLEALLAAQTGALNQLLMSIGATP